MGAKVGGTDITNGYLLQLIFATTYKIQFYISAADSNGVLQYRKMTSGHWENFTNV